MSAAILIDNKFKDVIPVVVTFVGNKFLAL